MCYGQAVSRTTYADLFGVILTSNGPGDGTTTFNLPDKRGRVSGGVDNMGGVFSGRLTAATGWPFTPVLGQTGGFETHTLDLSQVPSHNHGVNDAGHSHVAPVRPQLVGGTGRGASPANFDVQLIEATATNISTTGVTIQNTGGGLYHNNVQPTILCNYIIKY